MNGFYHYDTIEAFLSAADPGKHSSEGGGNWEGGENYATARKRCHTGNDKFVAAAEKIMSKIEDSGLIKRGTVGYVQDVAGEFPLVPAFVAGDHECMMRKGETELQTDRSPLKVFVGVGTSAAYSAEELTTRGIYILALVQLLNQKRAVELYWYSPLAIGSNRAKRTVPVVPIATQPMDVSTAAHILASAGFFRTVCFAFHVAKGGQRGWIGWATDALTDEQLREGLHAEADDLIIPHGFSGDNLQREPMKWLTTQLAKYAPDMLA